MSGSHIPDDDKPILTPQEQTMTKTKERKFCKFCKEPMGMHPPKAVVSHGICLARHMNMGGEKFFAQIKAFAKEAKREANS